MIDNCYKNYKKHLSRSFISSKKQYSIYENYYRKNILKFLPSKKSAKIVDLGCGLGHFLYFLNKNGYLNVEGIDLVEENVNFCKRKGFNAKKSDIKKYLSSKKEKADVFVLTNVLEHFSYLEIIEILDSLFDVLNKGGVIIIIIPNCNNIAGMATFFSDVTHKSPLTEKSFEDLIQKTNIKKYSFHNLIVYPNLFFVDFIFKMYNLILFCLRKINNLINGQTPYKVQSKNLLVVLEKEI